MRYFILSIALVLCSTTTLFAQKNNKELADLTYEMVQAFKKWGDTDSRYASYKASDGHVYKVGDTLEIGTSASPNRFKYYSQGDGVLLDYTPMSSNRSGNKVIIRGIRVEGGKREGFHVWMRVSNANLTASQITNFEGAIREGEVISQGITRETALKKLKEYKEMHDLDLISDEEFDKMRDELREIIRNN